MSKLTVILYLIDMLIGVIVILLIAIGLFIAFIIGVAIVTVIINLLNDCYV